MYFLLGVEYGIYRKGKPYNIKTYYKTNNRQSKRLKQIYESGRFFNETLAIIDDTSISNAKSHYKKYVLKEK